MADQATPASPQRINLNELDPSDYTVVKPAAPDKLHLSELSPDDYKVVSGAPKQGSEDNPVSSDIFQSAGNRMLASFGDEKGVAGLLSSLGYTDVKKNKDGTLIAKDKDGTWHSDQANFFGTRGGGIVNSLKHGQVGNALLDLIPPHPINAAEASVGSIPSMAGMMAGGTWAALSGAGLPLGAAAAGAGSALGEQARQAIGRAAGVYQGGLGQSLMDTAESGVGGAAAEIGGQTILKPVAEAAAPYAKAAISKGANLLSLGKLPAEDVLAFLNRPYQVEAMGQKDAPAALAKEALATAQAKEKAMGVASGEARSGATKAFGDEAVSTAPMLEAARIPVKESYTPQEIDALPEQLRGLFTKVEGTPSSALVDEAGQPLSQAVPDQYVPTAKFRDLQNMADKMSGPNFAGDSQATAMVGAIKGQLHATDKTILTPGDAAYADYKNSTSLLSPMRDPSKVEGFLGDLGSNEESSLAREQLKKAFPDLYQKLEDLEAAQGLASSDEGKSQVASTIKKFVGGLLGYGAYSHAIDPATALAIGVPAAIATSPTVIKGALSMGAKAAASPVMRNLGQRAAAGPFVSEGMDVKKGLAPKAAMAEEPEESAPKNATAIQSPIKPLYTSSPTDLKSLSAAVAQQYQDGTGQELGRLLGHISDVPDRKRNALLFTVQQNPAYREMLRSMGIGNDDGEDAGAHASPGEQ